MVGPCAQSSSGVLAVWSASDGGGSGVCRVANAVFRPSQGFPPEHGFPAVDPAGRWAIVRSGQRASLERGGKTAYGVTNRRLLWARGTTVRAVNLWSIANVTLARGGSRRAASWIEFRPPGDEGAPRPSALAWQSLETGTLDRPDRKNWSVESPEKVAALIREVMESGQAGGTTPQVQHDRSYQAER